METYTGIIYGYFFENGKCYIGQTVNAEQRHSRHLSDAKLGKSTCRKFHNALRKYEYRYDYKVLVDFTCDSKEELQRCLNKFEEFYIEVFDSFNNGYNLTKGGDGRVGSEQTEQTRRKISKKLKGVKKSEDFSKMLSERNRGKKKSPESIEKMRLKRLGSISSKRKVTEQYDLNGNLIKEYDSLTMAGESTGISYKNIHLVISGKRKTAGGYIWRYKE